VIVTRARATRTLGGLAAALLTAREAAAQRTQVTASVDAGVASVEYDEFLRASVGTISPSLRVEHGRATFQARGAYSRFETGRYSIEGTIAASVVSPAVWGVRGELYGTASDTRYSGLGDDAATSVAATGRLHWASARRGLWVGTGIGAIAQGFYFPDALLQLDAGAWARVGPATITARTLPTRVGDLAYADFMLSSRWEWRHTELTATAGHREGDRANGAADWLEAGGGYWFTDRVAVIGGAGIFPSELWRGLPGGRYVSTAVRLTTRPPRGPDPELLAELTRPYEIGRLRRSRAAARQFNVDVLPDGTRTLQIRVPDARAVELMGDFTDWTPVAMARTSADTWTYNVFIGPGVHRLNVRIDGGPWIAPPGLTAARDDFGGEVGLLVVQ
jgi:hypothetical protein